MNAANEQRLKLSLAQIAKRYPSGCSAYYEGQGEAIGINPWMEAHNELEKNLSSYNERLISNQISIFTGTIERLMNDYTQAKKAEREQAQVRLLREQGLRPDAP